jgi:hypothetical protein
MTMNKDQQRELAGLVELGDDGTLCEVGCGPGALLLQGNALSPKKG